MFFRSKAARQLIDAGHKQIPTYISASLEAGSSNTDRDAVVMYSGFMHFAIAYYLAGNRIKQNDIKPILHACSLHVRHYAPNHHLPDSYLEDTRVKVQQAIEMVDLNPISWTQEYFELMSDAVEIDEISFCASLSVFIVPAIEF